MKLKCHRVKISHLSELLQNVYYYIKENKHMQNFIDFEKAIHEYGRKLENDLNMFKVYVSHNNSTYTINYLNCYTGNTYYFCSVSKDDVAKDIKLASLYILKKIEIEVQRQNIQEDKFRLESIEKEMKSKEIYIPF